MVSVVVRCRNEERYIGYTIQSIYDYFGYDVEIIIVDNESTDNSIRVVNTFEYLNRQQFLKLEQLCIQKWSRIDLIGK